MLTNSVPPERHRDRHQWMLDWMVKTTGRVQNFAYDARVMPPEVKSYAQIPRVLAGHADHRERLARAAEERGHRDTALELYWEAADLYREGQHAIFRDDDPEKIFLHGRLLACFARVAELCPLTVEVVEISFEGSSIQGVFYSPTPAGDGPGEPRPTVVFCPGMDMTKESWLTPWDHPFVKRGFNVLHLDGPGQGTSNIRKLRVTLDNYERAGSAALDWLGTRPDVDADALMVSGFSMGSYWGMRIAATDARVTAVATAAACYGPKWAIFNLASPRFKQMFMYMAGIHDEARFDAMAAEMVLDELAPRIECPVLQVTGEYDPLAPLEDVLDVYEMVRAPKELWVVENDFHNPRKSSNFGGVDIWGYLADWLSDAHAGRVGAGHDRRVLVRQRTGLGPYDEPVESFRLPDQRRIHGEPGLTPAQRGPAVGVQAP